MWSVISVNIAAIVLGAAIYSFFRRPIWAAFIAAVLVAGGLQLVVRLELGYTDKLWPIAAATSFINAFAVALIVVFAWRYLAQLKSKRMTSSARRGNQ